MSDEHDELPIEPPLDLAALRAAWRSIAPPDPTASLDEPDASTRGAIDWMRAAWRHAAPAPVATSPLPWRLRVRIARLRVAPLAPWLMAAAALVACITWFARETDRRSPPDVELANHSEPADPSEVVAPKLVSLTADRMELRSGPVRLIVFTPSQESNR